MKSGVQSVTWGVLGVFGLATALAAPPNDPDFPLQWALRNVGQAVNGHAGQSGADVAAIDAWAIHSGGVPITVAIVSAGVDPHPEFADRLMEGHVTPLAGGFDPHFGHGRLNVARALQLTPPPPVRFEPADAFPTTLPPYQGSLVALRIANGTQRLIGASVQMIYRATPGGVAPPLPGSAIGNSLYSFPIPPMPCGVTIDYYYSVRTESRLNYFDPPNAPFSLYSAAVGYTPAPTEAFEFDSGWTTVVEGGKETTGAWTRVKPAGTYLGLNAVQPAYDHTPDQGQHCFVTGQHFGGDPGTNDADGGPVRLISPLLFARAPDAEINYSAWVFSQNADATESADTLVVELSVDDGANWIPVEAIGPTNGWQQRRFIFSDYSSVRPDGFRVRFTIADLEFDSLTEAALDDVKIIPIGCDWPGDADHDGDSDYSDWRNYAVCQTGPGGSLGNVDCFPQDTVRDDRVDLKDAAVFLNYFAP